MLGLPYHSQGRGQVERANKTARSIILALTNSLHQTQANVINLAQFIANSVQRTYNIDTPDGPKTIKRTAYEMTFGHSPHLNDRNIIGSSPSNSHDHHIINVVRDLVGTYNHRVNREEDLKESQVRGTLQVGDLVLARVCLLYTSDAADE